VEELAVEVELGLLLLDGDEGAGVAGRDRAVAQGGLDAWGQPEEPERVRHRRPVLPYLVGHLLLRQPDLLDEPLVAEGDLDGVEVLALDVLDDGHLEHRLGVGLADEGGDLAEAGAAGGAEAALARDQLEPPVAEGAHRQRLDDAELADGRGELVECLLAEVLPRLVGVGPDGVDLDLGDAAGEAEAVLEVVEARARRLAGDVAPLVGGLVRGHLGQEGAEALAEGGFLAHGASGGARRGRGLSRGGGSENRFGAPSGASSAASSSGRGPVAREARRMRPAGSAGAVAPLLGPSGGRGALGAGGARRGGARAGSGGRAGSMVSSRTRSTSGRGSVG